MAKYLYITRYTTEGAKGIASKGGTARRSAIEAMAKASGGKLESFYFAFGEDDTYVTIDYPDNVSAAAAALAVNQSGAAVTRTIPLLTPEEIDQAAAKKSVTYRPPGK